MNMSTNDADRPRHYTAGDSTFAGDYLWSLKQVLHDCCYICLLLYMTAAIYDCCYMCLLLHTLAGDCLLSLQQALYGCCYI